MNYPDDLVAIKWQEALNNLYNNSRLTGRQKGFLAKVLVSEVSKRHVLVNFANEKTKEIFKDFKNNVASIFEKEIRENYQLKPDITFTYHINSNLDYSSNDAIGMFNNSSKENKSYQNSSTIDKLNFEFFDDWDEPTIDDKTLKNNTKKSDTNKLSETNQRKKTDNNSDNTQNTALVDHLNPRYTFDSFVRGHSNRFAHATAMAVSEAPAQAYNPLFIYGQSGLGKTHLLHAIGNYAQEIDPDVRVHYVNAEEFTNAFINSIRNEEDINFKAMYRNVDILLVDDIQFFSGKERTQEEFFHTFNALYDFEKQIVITSDLPPKQLKGFEDRMRTRFEWGLITDVQPPELETRIAILRKKAENNKLEINNEVLEYIATKITSNVRELEGALIRVTAYANLNKETPNIKLAETVLKDLVSHSGENEITADLIIEKTSNYYNLSIEDLKSTSRTRPLVIARQIAMYLCRELTPLSLPQIGEIFGGRDHTTVIHADRKIRELMQEQHDIFNQVTNLTNKIKNDDF